MSTPKVRVGSRGIASISSEYGNALDSSATADAAGNIAGTSSCAPGLSHSDGHDHDGADQHAKRRGLPAVRGSGLAAEDGCTAPSTRPATSR